MSFIAPEDFDRVNEMNKRMLEKKTTSETLEFKIITSKGNQKTVSAVVNKRFNNRGGLTGIYGTLHDITYKNIAPVQIDNSIKAARELLNNTPCGLLTLDADRHITEINDFLLRLLGYNKEQVIARLTPADIVARNDRAYINDMLLRLRDEARTERMEINLVRVNKATVPVSLTAYSHFSETGEYVHTNMIFTDHTEVTTLRKTVAELEARAKENNDSPLMMITVGPDGIITGASGKFLNYLGYSERDVTGKTFSFAYDDETRRRTAAWYNKQLHDNVAETTWLLPAVSKNGDKHWLELTGNLTGNKEQTISCLVYDVTGRIKTEEELHEVAWMAMEARNAHQSLTGKLNSGLSEPANGIMSLVNMLGTTHLSVEQKVLVAGIKESSQHLVLAIDELKTDTDATETTPLNEDEFELKHLVNSVIFAHKPDADRKKLRFALQIDNKIPATVWGNPTLLSRILDHLVENAVKHTDSGSVSISVLQRDVLNNNLTLEFIVKDSGPGIAAMKLEKLLEGQDNMGLAATRLLVEQQNGQFRIRSNEEAGTVISFTYTLKKTLRSTPKEDKQHLKLTEESVSLLGYNILLVEDNVMNQRVGTVTVSNWGANVTVADRGRKAIDLMKHERFDVVLMDLQMPEMSGIEATEIIRQQLKDNTPIIGMTVSEQQGSRETCLKAGMNEYILKPLNPVELNQKMLSLLKKKAVIAPEKLTNINYIRNLTSDDSTLITEILEIYISKTPPLLAEIERYISSGQYKSAQAGVHYLKNSVGLLGADTLFHLLATIEDQLNYLPPSEDTLKLLVKMYESVMQSIHDAEEDLSNL
jgi:PAS domain S-box-containing protein